MMPSIVPPGRMGRWDGLALAIAGWACLLPFVGKAVHIDDPLFVWAAQHIARHPLDFFGFNVHWYISWQPMAEVTQNPPGACYYLALAGSLFGWGETGLHLAMTLPALGVLWGTYRLAGRLGVRPLPAALLTLASPAFLLCSSSLMCDSLMLCFWVWAIVFWDEGLRGGSVSRLYGAALLVGLATLTKYFGACLLPLLAAYALAVDAGGWRRWLAPAGLTVTMFVIYQHLTHWLYGFGHIGEAMKFARSFRGNAFSGHAAFRLGAGLAFVGGCVGVPALATIALLGQRSRWLLCAATIAVLVVALYLPTTTATNLGAVADSPFSCGGTLNHNWLVFAQFAGWVAAGAAVLLLAGADLVGRRDATAVLLLSWVVGTYLFAAHVNWAMNGRSVMPLMPAVAILIVRRLDAVRNAGQRESSWFWPALLVPSLTLALAVTWADTQLAESARTAAGQLAAQHGGSDRQLWYTGHWGFQYYMTEQGALPWDYAEPGGRAGDRIIVPQNNTQFPVELPRNVPDVAVLDVPAGRWLTTFHKALGAGYYSDYWGPLPFVFGNVPPERYVVKELLAPNAGRGDGR